VTTIAQDYAAELRRISCSLFQAGKDDDAEELRLAAEYLEQQAKAAAVDEMAAEKGLSQAERRSVDASRGGTTAAFHAFVESLPRGGRNGRAIADLVMIHHLDVAACLATSGKRFVALEDFLETARESWGAALIGNQLEQAPGERS
jgi:hypothetical protein